MNRFRNRICEERLYCDGEIDCPWLTPNDEANCSDCPSYQPTRCECNRKENFMCKTDGKSWNRLTCYYENDPCK